MKLDPDPLTILEDHGYPLISVDHRRRSRRRAVLAVLIVAGFVATVIGVQLVRAAPRSAHLSTIPVVDDGRTGAPQRAAGRDWDAVASGAPSAGRAVGKAGSGLVGRESFAPAPALSGIASWYPARGLIAAAGPGLRQGHWRGSHLVVSANGRSVTVELADWCACPHGRLIDLSDDAFARLAPLSRGLVRVTIAGIGPAPTLPATDRSTP